MARLTFALTILVSLIFILLFYGLSIFAVIIGIFAFLFGPLIYMVSRIDKK